MMSALISLSNKCNIISYQNSKNNGNSNKNSNIDKVSKSDNEIEVDSYIKMICK